MRAVFERDFLAYWNSPIGYVFVASFLVIGNLFFYFNNVLQASANIAPLFMILLMVLMLLMPLLTMRSFSEEFRSGTDRLLLTTPLGLYGIVCGKFFAALGVFLTALAFTLIWVFVLALFGSVAAFSILGNYIAIICAASTFIAIGLFVSSLTESQLVAAIVSFAAFFGLYILDFAASAIDISFLRTGIGWFSIFMRFGHFTRGIFRLSDILYYILFTVTFLFLAVRVLEKKRWA